MKLLITIYSHARLSAGGAVSACDQSEWPKIHIVIPAIRCVHTMQGRWRMSSRFFHCQDIWTADMWVLDVLRHQAGDQNSEYTFRTALFILHISLLLIPFKWVLTYLQYCLNLWYPLKGCMPGPWAWLVVVLWCECVWHIAASHQSPVTWLLPNEAHISHLDPNNGLDPDLLSMVPSLNPHYTHLCHHLVYSSCLSSWGSKYK